ncbi:MAG: glycosyltransferase family 2 protein, partial [Pseudomonadota bacterium]
GDVIILLNNDVFVTPGWADRLTAWLDEFSIVGPMTNYCAGAQMTTIGCYENLDELNEQAGEWAQENEGDAKDVNFIIGLCFAFRRSLFDEIGPFDETLWPCSGEEIDFCFRAREAGHKIGVARDIYVHHEGSQTFNDMQKTGQINYIEMAVRNDKHLAKKWGWGFWERQEVT